MQPYDLTDLDTAKAFLRSPSSGSRPNQDTLLSLLVSAYSKAVGRYCDRQFLGKDPTAGGTITFDPDATSEVAYDYDGNGWITLGPWEAREIETVTLDGIALPLYDASAPTSETYSPLPLQRTTEATMLSLALPRRERSASQFQGHYGTIYTGDGYAGKVQVVAKWGIVGVPADVELATLIAVADGYRNPEGAASRTMGDFAMVEQASNGVSLPSAARALLSPLQRS